MLSCTSAIAPHVHRMDCRCGSIALSRRSALRLGLASAAVGSALLSGRGASAAGGNYEAMLLNCIDPRFVTNTVAYMDGDHLKGQYSQFVFAGGPIGAVAPKFASWHQTFWDNLAVSVDLHRIKKVIALSHRDCGAASIAYGEAAVKTPDIETATHTKALQEFRAQCGQKQPQLAVVTGIMALDGSVLVVQ